MCPVLAVWVVVSQLAPQVPIAPPPREVGKSQLYFPTTVGTKLVMRDYNGDKPSDVAKVITAVESVGAVKTVTVETAFMSKDIVFLAGEDPGEHEVRYRDKWRVSSDGWHYRSAADWGNNGRWEKCEHPKLHELPCYGGKNGESWDVPYESGKIVWTIERRERVKVIAGMFDAVVVGNKTVEQGKVIGEATVWYVRDVGVVKATVDGRKVSELVSFTPGKKEK